MHFEHFSTKDFSMQKFTQKYTIIQLLEPVAVGMQFSSGSWPLHSTVVDTFAVSWDATEMITELEAAFKACKPAHSIAEDDTFFGVEKDVQVTLLRKTDSLTNLHHNVLSFLEKGGLILNDPQFAREGFLPHATVQKHTRLTKGDEVSFTALSIIDMFPDGDAYQRKVLATIPLGT
jgi:hypothetical protein